MQADIFKDIIIPVIGGLGIFMLGLEFMSNGIQSLAVNRMRSLLAKIAGTPIKGVMAGTFITGIIQSSTAMTVMVVGLVNAGVVALRPAITVIMGANIGTTLGNGLIALPLGPLGLLLAGFFGLIYVFSKDQKIRNIALACVGFALIFYGLNLMTGGLRPLRSMPEVMSLISGLNADSFLGLVTCVLIAAGITAAIHSSSATIGIVMGLGASGVLDWQTAVAFSLGADLGTTITSWIASLNLSKNAKRAAYAHISFNIIGVLIMLPLFFPSMILLVYVMGWFGGDPGVPHIVDGKETFPLVPVAVGIYSTCFNIFNTLLLFPFIGVFERVLSRVGASSADDIEDYSQPRFVTPKNRDSLEHAVPAVQQELARYLSGVSKFLAIGHGSEHAPKDAKEHYIATDILSREIRSFASAMFRPDLAYADADLVASLIEEADFTASLGETLYQTARRIEREEFSSTGRALVEDVLNRIGDAMTVLTSPGSAPDSDAAERLQVIADLRERSLKLGPELPGAERGSILALLGSAERAYVLIDRIHAERRSVSRVRRAAVVEGTSSREAPFGGGMVPAE